MEKHFEVQGETSMVLVLRLMLTAAKAVVLTLKKTRQLMLPMCLERLKRQQQGASGWLLAVVRLPF
jgi:hypothetical protein